MTTRNKIEKRDKIEQIDALSFGEESPKLSDFIRCTNRHGVDNYFAFLLARERVKSPGGVLRLVTVRVRWAANEELMKADGGAADSFEADEEESKMASNGKKDAI